MGTHTTHSRLLNGSLFCTGEGQHCHVHDVLSGRQVSSTQVFCAAVVHGLSAQPSPADDGSYLLLVFGQKSFAVLLFSPAQEELYVYYMIMWVIVKFCMLHAYMCALLY